MITWNCSQRYGTLDGSGKVLFASKKASQKDHDPSRLLYPAEILENIRKNRYRLFMQVGNMKDILGLSLDDFYGIIEVSNEDAESMKKSGSNTVQPLKESQRDMIRRAKGEKIGS